MTGRLARCLRASGWGGFLPVLILAMLSLGWELLAWQNFAYPLLHRVLSIDETIDQYGPLNQIRPGFHQTSRAEQVRLFGLIVKAIHRDGEGLADLRYHHADGQTLGHLLTPAEVIHLQDVAQTVSLLRPFGWAACVVLVVGSTVIGQRRLQPPWRNWLLSLAASALLLAGVLWLVGAEALFYQLHRWWFPADHQWFFYYEESLMSMMMKAPHLFGAIAVLWVAILLLLLMVWRRSIMRWVNRSKS